MLSQLNGKEANGGSNGKNCESRRKRRGTGGCAGVSVTEKCNLECIKSIFSKIKDENIEELTSSICCNYPSKTLNKINGELSKLNPTSVTNGLSGTTVLLDQIKNHLTWFSGHITYYFINIKLYLIPPLSDLTKNETKIETGLKTCQNNNGIKTQYETIKHKVNWCKSSLEFEIKRLQSISSNSELLENQLEPIIEFLKKYKTIEENLKEFKQKLKEIQENKKNSILKLTKGARSIICNLRTIENISNCLKGRKDRVSIMTIKDDIEYIKSEIEAIQNIVSYVQLELSSLGEVRFDVNCQTVNQVECCIKEIVSIIHNKYYSLSSITSQINIGEECNKISTESLTGTCKLPEISECASAGPGAPSSDSCQSCATSSENQQCQCCQSITQCLNELISQASSCEAKMKDNLKCIQEVIKKLTTTQQGQTTHTCPANTQCQVSGQPKDDTTCQPGGQAQSTTGCSSQGGDVKKVIKCIIDEIKIVKDNVKKGMIRV